MQTLNRYISAVLIKSVFLVLLVFVGLEIFILLATQLKSLGKGSYTIFQAVIYVLLVLPQQTYLLFPMAGLLGVLFGLSGLASHSELIVMRASGVSPMQILYALLKTGLVLILLMGLLGEVIGPAGKSLAEKRKLIAMSTQKALKTEQGLWLRQDNNFYYIKTIYSAKHIAGVSRYVFSPDQQLVSASTAREGHYRDGLWQMSDIHESRLGVNSVSSVTLLHGAWYLAIDPRLLRISQKTLPEEMSLRQLSDLIHYQITNHLAGNNNQIIFWQRIFQPLASLVMMILAVPFVFGSLRTAGTSLRLVLGTVMGFIFYLFNQLFPPLSQVLNFPPILAALLPLSIFAILGFILIKKIR